jgi:DNA-3-methyladenine glycosylase
MKWQREDYMTDAVTMARKLIGAVLVHRTPEGETAVRITETEAYGGFWQGHPDDGAHAFKGITPRTRILFEGGGTLYVYQIYGMYFCFDIVCGPKGSGESALVRAGEPLRGLDLMRQRRNNSTGRELTCGPARLAMAMGIDRSHYGADLTGTEFYIEDGPAPVEIETTTRKNIDYAVYGKSFPWRFTMKGSRWISR